MIANTPSQEKMGLERTLDRPLAVRELIDADALRHALTALASGGFLGSPQPLYSMPRACSELIQLG